MRHCVRHAAVGALLAAGALVAPPAPVVAQSVMIAPNAIMIDGRSGTGAVTIVNGGDKAAEVSLSSMYGYPVTDSAGRMRLETFSVVDDTMPSASTWLRAFPERFVLGPGVRRTVRLLVTPPAGIADREYWARLVVSSHAAAEPAPTSPSESSVTATAADVRVGLALEVRSVLGVFYRRGAVSTGVELDSARADVEGDSIIARVRMARTGNAAFVGSLRGVLRDSSGTVRATATLPLGVYYTLEPRIAFTTAGLPAGRYAVELDVQATRPDVASSALLPARAARAVTTLVVPPSVASRPNEP